jgi:hypothetical protein
VLSLTYFSTASSALGKDDLVGLLDHVRAKNDALGLTGMLLYSDGSFVQTLEGPQDVVEETFGRIAVDRRHRDIFRRPTRGRRGAGVPDVVHGFPGDHQGGVRELAGFQRLPAGEGTSAAARRESCRGLPPRVPPVHPLTHPWLPTARAHDRVCA